MLAALADASAGWAASPLLGLVPGEARSRAVLAYTTYVGLFSLRRAAPGAVSDDGLITALEPLLSPGRDGLTLPRAP